MNPGNGALLPADNSFIWRSFHKTIQDCRRRCFGYQHRERFEESDPEASACTARRCTDRRESRQSIAVIFERQINLSSFLACPVTMETSSILAHTARPSRSLNCTGAGAIAPVWPLMIYRHKSTFPLRSCTLQVIVLVLCGPRWRNVVAKLLTRDPMCAIAFNRHSGCICIYQVCPVVD